MENVFQNNFSFNYKDIVIDEVALCGLEGAEINLLWRLMEKRASSPITEKMKSRFWTFIVNCKDITLYHIPEPLPHVELIDRFAMVCQETGQIAEPADYIDGPYEYHPVDNEYGSCKHYKTRTVVNKEQLKTMSYETVVAEYGDKLVMVASIQERWRALAPHMPFTCLAQMTPIHYSILELVGRGRENGQATVGKSNLLKVVKDSKLLFYNRSYLQNLDLVRVQSFTQTIANKGVKSLLLRLKRFHKPALLSMPKVGILHNIVEYLTEQPDYTQRNEVVVKRGLMTRQMAKRLHKNINIFHFEERVVSTEGTSNKKSKSQPIEVKRRFITLTSPSDDESYQSDGETTEPLKCQYKVKVNLFRQAYERFLDAGLKGHTQVEIAQLLGVEFYTARSVCRILKSKNLIREFMEDRGKQRIARYIAVTATGEMDIKYEVEKKKFLEYLSDSKSLNTSAQLPSTSKHNDSDTEVPRKKRKLEEKDKMDGQEDLILTDSKSIEKVVTEISMLDGLDNKSSLCSLLDSKKGPTLRQLRFANGMLKVIREKHFVSGYQTLSNLVSKEINEPPLDTKSLKIFVQKLVTDGQLKIMKMKWPGFNNQKHCVLICGPHVNSSDPVIKAKYKELSTRAINNKKLKLQKILANSVTKPLSQFAYPRYMKIQKLHELIMKVVYFKSDETLPSDLPNGFTSLVNILPEFTVEFALGNISHCAVSEINPDKVTDDILNIKLRNTPKDVYKMFLLSSSLQSSIRTNLKVLAMLGLIQLVQEHSHNKDDGIILSYVFHVNRNVKVTDTTGMWPRKNVNKQSLEKKYYFETFQGVEKYWADVYNISTKTTIDLPSRPRKKLLPPTRSQSEVLCHDNAQCHGDGLGPCGFDSVFYMEMPHLWSTFYSKERKQQRLLKKKLKIKTPKKEASKKTKVSRKKRKTKPVHEVKPGTKRQRKREPNINLTWTKEEDNIIMFCKAAVTIMSPVAQPGSLRLRNFVARDILSMSDLKKTGANCHKRALHLEANSSLAYEKECLINELKRRGNVVEKYEDLLKKLRIRLSGNMSKLMHEARLPMLELVWMMSRLIKSKSYNEKVPCVAMDFEDFHKNFTIRLSSANRGLNLYKTPADYDISIPAIKEGIVLTVMSTYRNEPTADTAKKIYSMFSTHAEQYLRNAVEQLRKCGAVSARDKVFNNQIYRIDFQDIVQSSYKISVSYQRKWICRLNSEFVENIANTLYKEISQSDLKGTPELNCVLCELQTCGILDIVSMTGPVISGSTGNMLQDDQIGDLDNKFSLKSGSCGWRNKTNITKLAQAHKEVEFEETLESLTRCAFVKDAAATAVTGKLKISDKILTHLKNKKETGSSFQELQELTGYDPKTLTKKLSFLESKKKIIRVGYFENQIVLPEFLKPHTMQVEGQHVIPTPWLTFGKEIRYDIFLKWAGVIMNKIFEHPGCSVSFLADACELLTTRSAQDLCMFLEKCECITLGVMKVPEPNIFSDDDVIIPELDDYSPYESVDNVLAFPVKDSLTKYACLRKRMLDK